MSSDLILEIDTTQIIAKPCITPSTDQQSGSKQMKKEKSFRGETQNKNVELAVNIGPRAKGAFASWKTNLYLVGGGQAGAVDVHQLVDGNIWIPVTPNGKSPSPRTCFASTEDSDKPIFFLSGGVAFGTTLLDDLFEFHMGNQTWHMVPQRVSAPRRHSHALAHCYGALHMFGGLGLDGTAFGELLRFDSKEKGWTAVINPLERPLMETPCPRSNHSMCSTSSEIFLFGGVDEDKNILDDIWKVDLRGKRTPFLTTSDTESCDLVVWRRVIATTPIPRIFGHTMFAKSMLVPKSSKAGGESTPDSPFSFTPESTTSGSNTVLIVVGEPRLREKRSAPCGVMAIRISTEMDEVPGRTSDVDAAMKCLPVSIPQPNILGGFKLGKQVERAAEVPVALDGEDVPLLKSPAVGRSRANGLFYIVGGVKGIATQDTIFTLFVPSTLSSQNEAASLTTYPL